MDSAWENWDFPGTQNYRQCSRFLPSLKTIFDRAMIQTFWLEPRLCSMRLQNQLPKQQKQTEDCCFSKKTIPWSILCDVCSLSLLVVSGWSRLVFSSAWWDYWSEFFLWSFVGAISRSSLPLVAIIGCFFVFPVAYHSLLPRPKGVLPRKGKRTH